MDYLMVWISYCVVIVIFFFLCVCKLVFIVSSRIGGVNLYFLESSKYKLYLLDVGTCFKYFVFLSLESWL